MICCFICENSSRGLSPGDPGEILKSNLLSPDSYFSCEEGVYLGTGSIICGILGGDCFEDESFIIDIVTDNLESSFCC